MPTINTLTHTPAGPLPSHPCPITGCSNRLRHDVLLCWKHWQLVPRPIRANVWREWNLGSPTPAYPRERQAAIDAVNALEARR